jgi:hypothetical protein
MTERLRGQYSKIEVGYFPVLPERLRSVSFLLYGIVYVCTRKYMHAETLALLTEPLYFPNMKYLK